ncbi:MAG TPA: hypothetical protein VES67_24840 [Vicinamibacterales bacterium]|nr:hypothetical protein [Vicinamibacterales bacterium]
MSTHLRSQEFVDALDGTLAVDRLEHLDGCEACRMELAGVQSVMTDVRPAGAVPDPSPLFWDHFSERVRHATAADPLPGPAPWWQSLWRPAAAFAAVAAVVALMLVTRTPPREDVAPVDQIALDTTAADQLSDESESSLAFLSAAASDLSWEEARAADLTPRARVVDSAIERLTPAQRAELVKLIREDLRSME